MKKERTFLSPAVMAINDGQLSWLPRNPRQWTREDVDRTKRSIAEDVDFLEDRPLLVVDGVVFGGNLRLTASKELALASVPVVVYTPEGDDDRLTIKRRSIKDNGKYGSWDWDEVADKWSDLPLGEWGVPVWDTTPVDEDAVDDLFTEAGEAKDKPQTVTVVVPNKHADNIEDIEAALGVTLEQWPGCFVK